MDRIKEQLPQQNDLIKWPKSHICVKRTPVSTCSQFLHFPGQRVLRTLTDLTTRHHAPIWKERSIFEKLWMVVKQLVIWHIFAYFPLINEYLMLWFIKKIKNERMFSMNHAVSPSLANTSSLKQGWLYQVFGWIRRYLARRLYLISTLTKLCRCVFPSNTYRGSDKVICEQFFLRCGKPTILVKWNELQKRAECIHNVFRVDLIAIKTTAWFVLTAIWNLFRKV